MRGLLGVGGGGGVGEEEGDGGVVSRALAGSLPLPRISQLPL